MKCGHDFLTNPSTFQTFKENCIHINEFKNEFKSHWNKGLDFISVEI